MGNILPDLTLDEESKKLLAWLMYETGLDASTVIKVIGRHYHFNKKQGRACFNLHEVLKLREKCGETEINAAQLLSDLKYRIKLKELGLTTEDLPYLSEIAEAMAQAEISYKQCAEFLKIKDNLEKAGIDIQNIEQLKANIESIGKMVEMPEEKVRELASWLADTHKLKEQLKSLEIEKQKAEGTLEAVRQQISMLRKERTARDKECCNVITQIEQKQKEFEKVIGELEVYNKELQKNKILIHLLAQFQQFLLSGKIDRYDYLWTTLRNLFELKHSQSFDKRPEPPEFSLEVRKAIINILEKIVNKDLIPSWEEDKWRRHDKIEAAEALCKAPSEALSKAEEGMKKIDEGLDMVRDAKTDLKRSLDNIKNPY